MANSVESVGKLIGSATSAGAEVFNLVNFEDVMIRENDKITGIVINWGPVAEQRLHVDPLMIRTKLVIDGTGHDAAVCNTILRRIPNAKIGKLGVLGEKPMWSEVGERLTVDATQEIYPGLIVAGMLQMQQPAPQEWGLSSEECSFQAKRLQSLLLTGSNVFKNFDTYLYIVLI